MKEGNLVSKLRSGTTNELITFTWDHRNRLIKVENLLTVDQATTKQVVLMSYDAVDRLVEYSVDPDGDLGSQPIKTERYIYDGDEIFLQTNGAGRLTNRYIHAAAVDQVLFDEQIATTQGSTSRIPRKLLGDHQDSVRTVVNSVDGAIQQRMEYDAFGKLIRATPSTSFAPNTMNGGGLTPSAVDSFFRYTGRPYFD